MSSVIYAGDKLAIALLLIKLKLQSPNVIGVDVAPGELQFFRSVLTALMTARSDLRAVLFYRYAGPVIHALEFPEFGDRLTHMEHPGEHFSLFVDLSLYITTEQFISGPPSVYTVTLFHGQPSKGLTFKFYEHDPLASNDAFFLYGPLQRQALEEHLTITNSVLPSHLSLFDVGYTKSDRLISGGYDRSIVLNELGLDPNRKTILYAPAFNEGASMREQGSAIVATLASMSDYNVIAKLAIDCLLPDMVGGEDWFETIGRFERNYRNFRLLRDLEADRGLAAADVLVTCVSSIGFEFLALKRPVIFVDTPKYFGDVLPVYFPGWDVASWVNRTVVNGGREFGLVVASADELPMAVVRVLEDSGGFPRHQEQLPGRLLYNPGCATAAAVDRILWILAGKMRSRRNVASKSRIPTIRSWLASNVTHGRAGY